MEEDDCRIVHTCGVCEEICDGDDFKNHPCLEGYNKYFIDENTLYFYPVLDDGVTIVRRSQINNQEKIVAEPFQQGKLIPRKCKGYCNIKNKKIQLLGFNHIIFFTNSCRLLHQEGIGKKRIVKQSETDRMHVLFVSNGNFYQGTSRKRTPISRLNFDEEESLILEVQNRPPLWNYTLPLKDRSMQIKKQLWEEVAQFFNGKFSAETLKLKFKSLYDTFRKIIQSEHQASGSGRINKKKWFHYDSMTFLRDNCLIKNTMSNIENEVNEVNERDCCTPSTSTNISDDSFIQKDNRRKRQRSDDDTSSAINRIAEAVCQPSTLTLPPPPEPDDVDSFLLAIGHHLRELPTLTRIKVIQQFLQIVYDELAIL
ncbi:uncharacterized protein [Temnothorax nylanderi]|uniref:uncharacterized protein n=1 Tax=Temnothorax nylanderi TaxID=102681 RepID=UPI003A887FB2